jgi:hypothetical protein
MKQFARLFLEVSENSSAGFNFLSDAVAEAPQAPGKKA